jgi:beta-glucosidase
MPLGARAEPPAFGDPGLSLRERADDLLLRLTAAEKIAMLHQYSPGVPRLGIAPFRTGTEALHGAAWLGQATVFPQAIGLGASWDPDLIRAVGTAVGEEVRALHRRDPAVSLNVWAPVVNLLRDPRWGRNEEGYSEDPLLTARAAVAYCRGLGGDHPVYLRTAPLLKHFLAYNNERDRATTSSVLRPRVLHEYELPPFHAPIAAGVAVGVMPSYNLVNGRPNHVSPYLERELRRWPAGDGAGDDLVVCSDAEAPSNLVEAEHYFADHPAGHAAALRAGVDSFTDHGEDSSVTIGRITEALKRGLLSLADVDRAVRRLLLLRLRLGEFDPDLDPYADARADAARAEAGGTDAGGTDAGGTDAGGTDAGGTDAARAEAGGTASISTGPHRDLARRAARQAIVVLKNDGVLPLTRPPGVRLAVVGPLAGRLGEDWYSGTMPYQVTVADGLREALRPVHGDVTCTDGADQIALRAAGGPEIAEFDAFGWGEGVITLRSTVSGRYLTVKEDGSLVADAARPNGWVVREAFVREPQVDGTVLLRSAATGLYATVDESGRASASAPDAAAAQPFTWHVIRDGIEQAVAAMRGADGVVVVVGNDPLINGRETEDRTTLALPPSQQRLVEAACAVHERVVLLVMSSYPYALAWARDNVPAIVWTCHGGQEAGHAVADVLLGAHDPTGRLPQTWYASQTDLPDILEYDIIKARRTYLYFEGTPLFPLGHGLSYTTFRYARLRLDAAEVGDGDTVTVAVDVTNTGAREGTEVVQVYTRALAPRCPRPRRALAGFARVTLRPGESVTVEIPLAVSSLAFWDVTAHRMTVDPGNYEIMAGSSSAAIHQSALLSVHGQQPGPRQIAGVVLAATDFDDYERVTLVDATKADGDAVTPAGEEPGWILFRSVSMAGRAGGRLAFTARVAREEPGEASLEVWCDHPGNGRLLGSVAVPCTAGRYAWADVSADMAPVTGVRDLYLVLRGALRLASVLFHAPAGGRQP